MTEKNLTEAEIMKALEWCELVTDNIVLSNKKGEKFPFALQSLQTIKQVLKDYNLKNAEIERLKKAIKVQEIMLDNQDYAIKKAKAEAIKEFAERVKEGFDDCRRVNDYVYSGYDTGDVLRTIDQIAKEMGVEL